MFLFVARHLLATMGVEPLGEEAERRLVALLESFGVVPSAAMRKALMQWKVEGWRDLLASTLRPSPGHSGPTHQPHQQV